MVTPVSQRKKCPAAPDNLGRTGRALWRQLHGHYLISDPHDVAMFADLCALADRIHDARATLARDGLTTVDRYGTARSHPCVDIERSAIKTFAALCRQLGLSDAVNPDEAGRIPRLGAKR